MAKKSAKQEREERMARLRGNQQDTTSQGGAMQGMLNENSRGANGIERKIYYLPMEELLPSKFNKYHKTEAEIINLAANIDATELQQPLLLRALPNGKYTILSGHTRYAAVEYLIKQGKWRGNQIMSIVTDVVERVRDTLHISDEKAEEIVVASANTQRVKTDSDILYEVEILEGLTQYYRDRGIKVISEEDADNLYFKAGDTLSNVRTREVIASKTGMSSTQVAKVQNINKNATDSVKKEIEEGNLSIGVASDVAKMSEEKQEAFVKEVQGKKADLKDLQNFKDKQESTTKFSQAEFKADIADIEAALQDKDIELTTSERKQYSKAIKTIQKLVCK